MKTWRQARTEAGCCSYHLHPLREFRIYRGLNSMAVLQLQESVFICKDQ